MREYLAHLGGGIFAGPSLLEPITPARLDHQFREPGQRRRSRFIVGERISQNGFVHVAVIVAVAMREICVKPVSIGHEGDALLVVGARPRRRHQDPDLREQPWERGREGIDRKVSARQDREGDRADDDMGERAGGGDGNRRPQAITPAEAGRPCPRSATAGSRATRSATGCAGSRDPADLDDAGVAVEKPSVTACPNSWNVTPTAVAKRSRPRNLASKPKRP